MLPGGKHINLHYAALVTDAHAEKVLRRVGLDLEAGESLSESDHLKLGVVRAILNDPDVLVVNAENMPRGLLG